MQYILIVFYLNEKIVLRRINMKLKFIRSVIAFCLTVTLAFNSVILTFAAPEDFYDLPLETQQQQQERLLKLLPDLYKNLQLCAYNSALAKELNHINLANEISELKGIQEKQKALLSEAQNSQQIINYGLQHSSWLLLDDQGLGKSLQVIYLAEELKRRGEIQHCFIICGVNSLKYNWASEIAKFSYLSYTILGKVTTKKGKVKNETVENK